MIDIITLEKHLKRFSLINNFVSVSIALVTALGVGYGFYYNTKFTQTEHTESIKELKLDVNEIKVQLNKTTLNGGISGAEITNLKNDVARIEANQNRIESKIDQVLIVAKAIRTN